MTPSHLQGLLLGITISICILGISVLFAWTEPSSNPPEGNVPGPINISNTGQSKSGGLILNTGGASIGLVVDKGDVGIGTTNPGYKLGVIGKIHATDDVCTDLLGGRCLSSATSQWITSGNNIYYGTTEVVTTVPDTFTKLLIGADGSGQSFIDNSQYNHPITTHGNVTQTSDQYKFGGKSAYFDGSGAYLSIPDSDNWYFGTEDFTIDFWVRFNSLSSVALVSQYSSSQGQLGIFYSAIENHYHFFINDDGWKLYFNFGGVTSPNTWYHIALVRTNLTTWYAFINGVSQTLGLELGSWSYSSLPNFSATLDIGKLGSSYFNGYLDEVRISKGIARWTSNFTPPALPYPHYSIESVPVGKVGIGTDSPSQSLEVKGSILADDDVCNGSGKCLSDVYRQAEIAGSNPSCPADQIKIMKAYNGTWYTGDNSSITSWNKVICGIQLTSDGTPLLVNNNHTTGNCATTGGTVVSDDSGNNMCRFISGICPSGWTQYQNWSANYSGTVTGGCCGGGLCTSCCSCAVSGHEWQNSAVIETCTCCVPYGSQCSGCDYCGGGSRTVYTYPVQVGCY